MGSVVSSLHHLKDLENENKDPGFFVFPDLSVRQEGSHRLKLRTCKSQVSHEAVVRRLPLAPFDWSRPWHLA